jgi:hypothetical protein
MIGSSITFFSSLFEMKYDIKRQRLFALVRTKVDMCAREIAETARSIGWKTVIHFYCSCSDIYRYQLSNPSDQQSRIAAEQPKP